MRRSRCGSAKINACEDGVEELFREPLKRLYDLTQNYYYNYGYAESIHWVISSMATATTACYSFFNIRHDARRALPQKR
jgi:hypothetical protein